MLTRKNEDALVELVEEFVKSRNGFYKEHCSDKFLSGLITMYLQKPTPRNPHISFVEAMMDGDQNAAYDSACWIFEGLLEFRCGAGGNGHHVAQNFTAFMMDRIHLIK